MKNQVLERFNIIVLPLYECVVENIAIIKDKLYTKIENNITAIEYGF